MGRLPVPPHGGHHPTGIRRTEGRWPPSHGSGAAAAGPPQTVLEAGARPIRGGESWDETPYPFHLSRRQGLEEWEPPGTLGPGTPQDDALAGAVAGTACCHQAASASRSATWRRFGSNARASPVKSSFPRIHQRAMLRCICPPVGRDMSSFDLFKGGLRLWRGVYGPLWPPCIGRGWCGLVVSLVDVVCGRTHMVSPMAGRAMRGPVWRISPVVGVLRSRPAGSWQGYGVG